jgi:hypothetical protein
VTRAIRRRFLAKRPLDPAKFADIWVYIQFKERQVPPISPKAYDKARSRGPDFKRNWTHSTAGPGSRSEDAGLHLRNFGVFEVKVRKARIGRNPNKPETDVPIPERAVVKFKPGKEMRELVLDLSPDK